MKIFKRRKGDDEWKAKGEKLAEAVRSFMGNGHDPLCHTLRYTPLNPFECRCGYEKAREALAEWDANGAKVFFDDSPRGREHQSQVDAYGILPNFCGAFVGQGRYIGNDPIGYCCLEPATVNLGLLKLCDEHAAQFRRDLEANLFNKNAMMLKIKKPGTKE